MYLSPCDKDCPDRRGGCQSCCEKWADYEKIRNAKYDQRLALIDKRAYSPAQERRYRKLRK